MAASSRRTFYDVLGLDRKASRADIKDAYRKMALRYHPDKNPGDQNAVAAFQEIGEAFETLYDNGKRTHYNIKIGVTRQASQPTFPYTSYWRTTSAPYYRTPPSERPASFWNEEPLPTRSDTPPRHNEWAEPTKDQEAKKEAEEKRKAARHEKRKRQLVTETSQKLAVALSTILQLDSAIEKAEAERKAAEDLIERVDIIIGEDELFWEAIFERNIKLNTLRREHASTRSEYRKLYRILRKLGPKQGEEAKEIYNGLRKRAKEEDVFERGPSDFRAHEKMGEEDSSDQVPKNHYENAYSAQQSARSRNRAPIEPSDPFSPLRETFSSTNAFHNSFHGHNIPSAHTDAHTHVPPDNDPFSRFKETLAPTYSFDGSADDQGLPSTNDDTYTHAEYDEDDPTDEEVILFEIRKIHATHKELQAEFWDISPDMNICSYCGNTCTVMMCPEWEVCGLRACEYCKNSN